MNGLAEVVDRPETEAFIQADRCDADGGCCEVRTCVSKLAKPIDRQCDECRSDSSSLEIRVHGKPVKAAPILRYAGLGKPRRDSRYSPARSFDNEELSLRQ